MHCVKVIVHVMILTANQDEFVTLTQAQRRILRIALMKVPMASIYTAFESGKETPSSTAQEWLDDLTKIIG